MWITPGNKRVFVDSRLGISKVLVKGFGLTGVFPQFFPHGFKGIFLSKVLRFCGFVCNYKSVISLTHLLTTVITTNIKYKTFSRRVRSINIKVLSLLRESII